MGRKSHLPVPGNCESLAVDILEGPLLPLVGRGRDLLLQLGQPPPAVATLLASVRVTHPAPQEVVLRQGLPLLTHLFDTKNREQ